MKSIHHLQPIQAEGPTFSAQPEWVTAEQIAVPARLEEAPLLKLPHLQFSAAGIAPYLRGPYSTMYVMRPGRFGSMRVFPRRRLRMHFIGEIWPRAKRAFRWLSTWRPIEGMTRIIRA
ncbi:methylmalonyl-CoA mutase [Nitritalea halalkaliphila LW7]|uniref:Methylmalonyl-CoA mutase n=1 Tax=Nitritalea halalkaliphila LW7 TaxID=1189621 RepID=I5C4C7_9BACT|nr:methylmalonyl-CoA mutase [Nitritalea halalkaliphila LW7]